MTQYAYQLEVKADGRVQLPLELRQSLNLTNGSRLIVQVQDTGHATLVTAAALAADLRGCLQDDGPSIVEELLDDRRQEVTDEARA
ncbi:SpoVT/AbrB domain-containing protein [Deinococcus ruber]|uniref:SpoVT-AbrB domain-containing protein n=1 Tax=Deinococcus ruber TaxID=1848197 RepID=A0A918CF98_9DEIO|nr:SpoVT/AbrB domain-containing protein [Deinococcus ruber]GGR20067.1 hypothetical protein GCM10008957_35600 [Deinococcus ruber]